MIIGSGICVEVKKKRRNVGLQITNLYINELTGSKDKCIRLVTVTYFDTSPSSAQRDSHLRIKILHFTITSFLGIGSRMYRVSYRFNGVICKPTSF